MRLHDLLDSHLRRNGLGRLDHSSAPFGELKYTDASHHLGTTRMSADPRDGVVDEHCRVHGVANLFIAGSGVFPTAGHANPTLTIVALAYGWRPISGNIAADARLTLCPRTPGWRNWQTHRT